MKEFQTDAYEKYAQREKGYLRMLEEKFISFDVFVRLFYRNRLTYEFKREPAWHHKYCLWCDKKVARCTCEK